MTGRKNWQNLLLEGRVPWAICVNFNGNKMIATHRHHPWRRFFLKKTEMEWDKTMRGAREATCKVSFLISKRREGGQGILNYEYDQ